MTGIRTEPPATGGHPDLSVVILGAGDPAAVAITLGHVRRERGLAIEVLVAEDATVTVASRRNEALGQATAPLVTFLRAGDRLVPGALRKTAAALGGAPRAAMAHGYAFDVDSAGRVPKLVLRGYATWIRRILPAGLDHREAMITVGNFVGGGPTYRRAILQARGGFEEAADTEVDFLTTLRLLDAHDVILVPELVCGRRGSGVRLTWGGLIRAVTLARRVARQGEARFLVTPPSRVWQLAAAGVRLRLPGPRVRDLSGRVRWRIRRTLRDIGRAFAADGVGARWLYGAVLDRITRWPFAWHATRPSRDRRHPIRVAYVLWRYPILSETFIRREIQALRRRATGDGLVVDVVADAPDTDQVDADGAAGPGETVYLEPLESRRARQFARHFLRRHPVRFLNLALFCLIHRYGPQKRLGNDLLLFRKALYLAGVLAQRGVTHIHAPWADMHALLARIAARLLDLPYSVQARAHEIHSRTYNVGLHARLAGAAFVITNSDFNRQHLLRLLGPESGIAVHVVRNGVRVGEFTPRPEQGHLPGPPRLLSVGRLVEQKGFRYLLQACNLLRDQGLAVHCDIIGGPYPDLEAATFVELKALHRRLALDGTVTFLGPRRIADVLDAYRTADLLVLPCVVSRDGGRDVTPNVLLEAMAMGVPVISTPVGAIPEIVEHGVTGWLVPPNDAHALAAAIRLLAADGALRQRLALAARARIEEQFDSDCNVRGHAELFLGGGRIAGR